MRFALFGLTVCMLAGCQDLPDVERLRCGNGIVEQQVDEDCDGVPAGSPFACGTIGGADACRFVCADTPCPTGWACGADDICRASTGTFTRDAIVQIAGATLELGDLDGDGALDLVSRAEGKLQVAHGTTAGRFEDLRAVDIPSLQARLTVADTDADGLDDVLFFSQNSLTILRGESNRTLVPAHVPESPALNAVYVVSVATRADDSHVLLTFGGMQSQSMGLAGRELIDDGVIDALGSGGMVLAPETDDLDGDLRDEIILGRDSGRVVVVFNIDCPDDIDAPCETVVRHQIELPGDAVLAGNRPLVGDLDNDGHADLLVVIDMPDRTRAIAVGAGLDGDAGFAPLQVRPDLVAAAGCAPMCADTMARFSAAQHLGDVVGDTRADIITGTAVFEVAGEGADVHLIQRDSQGEPLNIIDTVDVDGDGQRDVLGFGAGEVVYLLSDGARFTQVGVSLGNGFPPAFGDYDGDGHLDLATWQATGELVVVFSGPGGLPTEQAIMGRFEGPVKLASTQRQRRLSVGLDRPDELAVIARDGVTILYGDSGRLPAAFIGLTGSDGSTSAPVTQLAVGRFEPGPAQALAYLAGGRDINAHSAPLDALSSVPFTEIPVDGCANEGALAFLSRVIDWDADGVDELLHIESDRARFETPIVWNVHRARLDAGRWGCDWSAVVESNNGPAALLSTDLDSDGQADVLVLLSPVQAPQTMGAVGAGGSLVEAQLMVWLDAQGGNSVATQHIVQPNASAATIVDVGGERTVMSFGDGRAWSLTWNGSDFDVYDRFAVPSDVVAARAADLDGDGIDDLLIKTNTGVIVYRQGSCSAREAWLGTCTRPAADATP